MIAACLTQLSLARLRRMSTYPTGPREMTRGMAYFPRMLDKIRLHARGELGADYHENLGNATALDGVCAGAMRRFWSGASKKVAGSTKAISLSGMGSRRSWAGEIE